MAVPVAEQPVVEEVAQTTEQVDADILAGFNGEETPTETKPTAESTPEPTQKPVEAAKVAPSPTPSLEDQVKELLTRVTKIDQIEATFNKRFDESFGRIGRLQQVIKDQQAATPAGQAVEFSDEDFKELKEEFPELSPALLKGLNQSIKRLGLTGSFNEDKAKAIAQHEMSSLRETLAKELLEDQVEGWEAIVGATGSNTPFRQWLATQPKDYQDTVSSTWRPGVMAKAIAKFQHEQAAAAEAAAAPAKPKPADKPVSAIDRKARLAAAVAPQGTPGPIAGSTKTPEQEMLEGFNS